jgi:hypothetical protein
VAPRQREPGPVTMAAAMIVCCALTLLIVAGGLGAATGVLGGALRSPYVTAAGLAALAVAVAVYVIGRRRGRGGDQR